jgi:Flp pilus assembly protein TadG
MIKKLFNKIGKTATGQSLVEIAITAPLLIFMLIGVFEVGWALRGYLVLVNVNREITRFSVRPGYLDFSTSAKIDESFQKVRDWVDTSLGEQLNLNFNNTNGNATLIISHMVVNTGQPCKDTLSNQCDCSQVTNNSFNYLFPEDDFFIHPGMPGYEYQTRTYGPTSTSTGTRLTRVNFAAEITNTLKPQNNKLNCELIKKGGIASDDNIMITELFFDQPQLFGFPLVSNPITDPVPLYTRTSMRLVGASRGNLTQNINTIGPVCMAYPIIIHKDKVPSTPNTLIPDVLYGATDNNDPDAASDDRGFLSWNPGQNPATDYLENEIDYPQMAITQYINAHDSADTSLSIGDYIRSMRGNHSGINPESDPRLDALVGQEIVIPVWDDFASDDAYRVHSFIRIRLTRKEDDGGIELTSNDPLIEATYLGPDETCNNID